MRGLILAASVLALVAACAREAEAPTPDPIRAQTFAGCEWGEVRGADLAIWSYACGAEHHQLRLVADDALPGFQIEMQGDTGPVRRPVIRIFAIDAAAGLHAALPAVRAASPGPDTATCAFRPVNARPGEDFSGKYELAPTGEAAAAWEASVQSDEPEPQGPPCGDLGVSIAGVRTFHVMPEDPTKVLYIDWGSEIQPFDPATLRLIE